MDTNNLDLFIKAAEKISMSTYVAAEIIHKIISGNFGSFDLSIGAKK